MAAAWPAEAWGASQAKVHCVTDISHEFTFYFDGRFARNYVAPMGGVGIQNWATLHKCVLSNANLLVLQSGGTPCPYLPEDIAAVRRFLEAGGGVCVLGDYALFRDEKEYRLNELAEAFGAEFAAQVAEKPLEAAPELKAEDVRTYGGRTLRLESPADWQILIQDAAGRPVLARRAVFAQVDDLHRPAVEAEDRVEVLDRVDAGEVGPAARVNPHRVAVERRLKRRDLFGVEAAVDGS